MAIVYSTTAINARLNGLVSAIDGGPGNGIIRLFDGALLLAEVTLAKPSATVAGGVLNFIVPQVDLTANATGNVNAATVEDSTGVVMISGLTVGIPLSGANIIISNGLNSTLVTVGQVVTLVLGRIIGS